MNDVAPRSSKKPANSSYGLIQSEPRDLFRLLVEAVSDYAIFMLDPQGHVMTWNPGAKRLSGYTAQEIIGYHFSRFYTEYDITRDHPRRELEIAAQTGKYEEEGWRVRKDGSRFWANILISRILDEDGNLIGYGKVTRDLTERREAEEQLKEKKNELRKTNEELEARVRERTESLAAAVRSRDEFLSIASHELKTPLTTLQMQAQMRLRSLEKLGTAAFNEAKIKKMVTDDEKQIRRLTRLVDDMLDISRLTTGRLQLSMEDMDLAALVTETVERLTPQIQIARCAVALDAHEPVIGYWDRYRMEQVFSNLLTNALKYGPGRPVAVSVALVGNKAVLSVQDYGMGIAPEDQARIFNQFERAVSASEVSGLGLGLFIVKQILQGHGGTIRVQSEVGKGATFIVELPLEPPNQAT